MMLLRPVFTKQDGVRTRVTELGGWVTCVLQLTGQLMVAGDPAGRLTVYSSTGVLSVTQAITHAPVQSLQVR